MIEPPSISSPEGKTLVVRSIDEHADIERQTARHESETDTDLMEEGLRFALAHAQSRKPKKNDSCPSI